MPQLAAESVGFNVDPAWETLSDGVITTGPRPVNTVTSPIDGRPLAEVPIATPDDVVLAAGKARAAATDWASWPLDSRLTVIDRFMTKLIQQRDPLLDLVHAESGKARVSALEEFFDVVLTAGYYAAKAPRVLRRHRRRGALPLLTSTYVRYPPKGVVGIISPWNYPLTLAISDALPALLAGNAVILKPDSLTPLTALYLVKLLWEAGLPRDVLQVVTGQGSVLGKPIVDLSDYVMFTGSERVGRLLSACAGQRLIGVSAELGGKNPMLVMEDAPLARAVAGAVQACFANSGQLCVSIERLFVARPILEYFTNSFAARTAELRLGGGSGWDVDMGPLISAQHLAKVVGHLDDAVAKGAKIITGGKVRRDLGELFFEPTILSGVTEGMDLFREETFGPVVALYPFDSEEEAIALANDSAYGLNASVWTRSAATGRRIAEQLRAGTVNINEGYAATFGSTDAPMGGFGDSGLGRRHGVEGLIKYTEPQTISRQRLSLIAPPDWLSRSTYAAVMTSGTKLLHTTASGLIRKVKAL
jgi:succinate-semialdehyde dehydrogenase/glutarate-semialdehyde dehydrogenase